ncbi:MAG: OmpH family outer membrane protein [Candidatus Cloacimonetes bacterium]|nr:OmpH family outer membrane protein [Candidatus Cloacimonadota bacterium]
MRQLLLGAVFLVSAGMSSAMNLGTVDMAKVLFYFDEVKILRIEISNRESRYQADLNQEQTELDELGKKINDPKTDETARQEMEKDYSRRMFSVQRKFEEYKQKLEEQKDTELEKIRQTVYKEIDKIAKLKKLDFVMDTKQVYFGKTVDLTDELIEKLNNRKPATGR